ncbi:MAG: serine hydrolase [Anaerolineales bacterium]|nr:serine hydrolase [Anaerolineales bacterium]
MTSSSEIWNRFVEFTEEEMDRLKIPGVAIGVLHNEFLSTKGLGVTSIKNPLPVHEETLFQIGSITKTFTCSAIMSLIENEKLSLDTKIINILPDFKLKDDEVTSNCNIQHLLTHSGGWVGDFFIDTGSGDDALDLYMNRMTDLDQVASLGSYYSYNNSGFSLLGLILERIHEKSYEEAISETILAPLDMDSCHFKPTDVMVGRFCVGHRIEEEELIIAKPWHLTRCAYPAGGLVASVGDLLKYSQFHLNMDSSKSESILTNESRLLMQKPHYSVQKDKEDCGLSWRIQKIDKNRVISHGGATNGQIALLLLVPKYKFALVVLANADLGRQLIKEVQKWCLKEYLNIDTPPVKTVEATPEEMKELEGRYTLPKVGYTDIAVLGDTLVAQDTYTGGFPTEDTPPPPAPPPYRLAFTGVDNLVVLDGEGKDFESQIIRDDEGKFSFLRMAGRLHVLSN